MAKPICVVYYHPELVFPSDRVPTVKAVNETFKEMFPDYHTLAIPSYESGESIRLEVFNADKLEDMDLEDFKIQILSKLKDVFDGSVH